MLATFKTQEFHIQLAKELILNYCSQLRCGCNGGLIHQLSLCHFPRWQQQVVIWSMLLIVPGIVKSVMLGWYWWLLPNVTHNNTSNMYAIYLSSIKYLFIQYLIIIYINHVYMYIYVYTYVTLIHKHVQYCHGLSMGILGIHFVLLSREVCASLGLHILSIPSVSSPIGYKDSKGHILWSPMIILVIVTSCPSPSLSPQGGMWRLKTSLRLIW